MSVISRIESLPGRIVRGIFRTTDALEINKILGAILAAGLLAMVTGVVADILVPSEGGAEHGKTAMTAGPATAGAKPAGEGAVAATVEPVLPLLAAASAETGKEVAKKCAACHTFEKGAAAKVGPNLYGIVGAKRAHAEGFPYSDAIRNLGGQWTYQELNKFIAGPRADVPGTKMGFAGLKSAKDRADVIAFLRANADTPAPLPTAEEIAAEAAQAKAQSKAGQPAAAAAGTAVTPAAAGAAPAAAGGAPAAGGGDVVAMIAKATPDQGKEIARKCASCHSFEKGQGAKVGPNLYNVVGSDIAAKEFAYSDALKAKDGTWTYQNLDAFLSGPRQFVPGTKMTFPGLKKPEERAAVIAYLRTLNDNPPPLQ